MVTHEGTNMTSIKKCMFRTGNAQKKASILQRRGSRMMLETEFSANFASFFSVIKCHFSKVQPLVLS